MEFVLTLPNLNPVHCKKSGGIWSACNIFHANHLLMIRYTKGSPNIG